MIRPIVKDVVFLGEKSEDATKADLSVVEDLIDTLRANLNGCVGMAANMIGVKKRIIVFAIGEMIVPMINPVIVKKEKSYLTEESCLSLTGIRQTTRYETIVVELFQYKACQYPHCIQWNGMCGLKNVEGKLLHIRHKKCA